MNRERALTKRPFAVGIPILIMAVLATMPLYVRPYLVILGASVIQYIVITLSWAIFSGPTRYISLASAAFFGIGVYVAALLGEALPLPLLILAGGLVSFILALCIGFLTLRLKGMYFIIFTFGISELIRNFLLWFETNFTGTVGRWVVAVDHTTVYYIMLIIFIVAWVIARIIRRSKFGLALRSIGENEEAAVHIGINVTILKAVTFALSAFFIGAAGTIMATRWTYIDPIIAFNPLFSFMPVLMAIFGGIGHLYGAVIGATIFSLLEEVLITEFPYYYMLFFGIILIAVILFLPSGLMGLFKKR